MGQGRSLPALHPNMPSSDGVSIISDYFADTTLTDDFDELSEAFLRLLKAPNVAHMPVLHKETVVREREDDGSFEVYVVLDAAKVQEVTGGDSGERKNRIMEHKVHVFNYDARSFSTVAYKDHWEGDTPEIQMQYFISFGEPTRMEMYVVMDGKRLANESVVKAIEHILVSLEFDLRLDRLPECRLEWVPDGPYYTTGRLGGIIDYDTLFDKIHRATQKSLIPPPTMPKNIQVERKSLDHFILYRDARGDQAGKRKILELKCVQDKIQGYILREYSTHTVPNILFKFERSPLSMKVFVQDNDEQNITSYHYRGWEIAQVILDTAVNDSNDGGGGDISCYMSRIGACCASRSVDFG